MVDGFQGLKDHINFLLPSEEQKSQALRYVPIHVEDLWSCLDTFSGTGTYDEWKTAVIALYPEANPSRRFTLSGIEDFVAQSCT